MGFVFEIFYLKFDVIIKADKMSFFVFLVIRDVDIVDKTNISGCFAGFTLQSFVGARAQFYCR